MALRAFKSKRYVISAKLRERRHKIFQMMFAKRDGSIFINFPYFSETRGLVSLVTYPGDITTTKLPLEPGGRVTSHLVKYSHHQDGRAHFSQDSRIKTEIKKASVPLSKINGHFFTVQIQGLHSFDSEEPIKINTAKKAYLDFDFRDNEPESIKIVGRLYEKSMLENNIVGPVEGPIVPCVANNGEKSIAFLLGDPIDRNQELILLINCFSIPRIDKDNETALTFIGAFDELEIIDNLSIDTHFLALSYPVTNYYQLLEKIGTVDFVR